VTESELAALYEAFAGMVQRRCMQILHDPAEAQDAMQETFMRALRARGSFRGEAAPLAWLYSIAHRHCLDRLRKRRRMQTDPLTLESAASVTGELETSDIVRRLLGLFDRTTQLIVVHYYFDELDQSEIAQQLQCSRRTVINKLNAFRERARRVIASWGARS